jgi:hypothetical protein
MQPSQASSSAPVRSIFRTSAAIFFAQCARGVGPYQRQLSKQFALCGALAASLVCLQAEATQVTTIMTVQGTCGFVQSTLSFHTECISYSGSVAEADLSAFAAAGTAKAAAFAHVGLTRTGDSLAGQVAIGTTATASFVESVTLTGKPLGTVGYVTYGIDMTGSTSYDLEVFTDSTGTSLALSSESFTAAVMVGSQSTQYAYAHNASKQFGETTYETSMLNGQQVGSLFGLRYFTLPVVFGQAFTISMQVSALAAAVVYNVGPDGHANAVSNTDLGHSLYWGGVQSVMVDGIGFADYSLIASTGQDYSKSFAPGTTAIPEPTTTALMFLGICGIALVRPRKRASITVQ